jgi:hypothetical protein
LPWLSQGDFYEDLPQPEIAVDTLLGQSVGVQWKPTRGPALLITYSSVIDKRVGKSQVAQASRFQFCPVYDFGAVKLDPDQQHRLRNWDTNPAEVVYLDLGDGQEGLAFLSEAYTIPTPFFSLESRHFPDHPDADARDPNHMCANDNDGSRVLSMEPHELDVLLKKLAFHWSRTTRQ